MIVDLEEAGEEGAYILAPFGTVGRERLESLGVYYIKYTVYLKEKSKYLKAKFWKIIKRCFLLRYHKFNEVKEKFLFLKYHIKKVNESKKDAWEEEEKKLNLNNTDKYIDRVCKLPDKVFYEIIKYCK